MAGIVLERVVFEGSARELGRAHGEFFRDRIRAFLDQRFSAVAAYLSERGGHAEDGLLLAGRASMERTAEWDSEGHDEHLGIAEGAGVDPIELFTAANMTDMRDVLLLSAARGPHLAPVAEEGCSSVLVPASHGGPMAGQTWDLNPPDVEFIVAIHRKPRSGPQTWMVTCTGCLTLMGINEHGLAVGTTNIKTYGSRPGAPYLPILHRAIRCSSATEAAEVVRTAPHAGAHTYWVADSARQLEWEASPNFAMLRDAASGPLCRSNHCLTPEHKAIEGETSSVSSRARLARMQTALSRGPMDPAALRALFADRSDGVHSINRYAEDGEAAATNAVFIALPAERRALACRGPADRGEWVSLDFAQ